MQIDDFSLLTRMNQAQLVALHEAGLVSDADAKRFAAAMRRQLDAAQQPDAARPGDYLKIEKQLAELAGPDASNLHMGRSRNDMGAARERMWLRHDLLLIWEKMLAARCALLDLAEAHTETIIPAYTHAVQAQPTTLAHYLLALAASLERDAQRLAGCWVRLNQSPLGAGALSTSGFNFSRHRLAELLGFEGLCENAYDCIGIASADTKAELASALSISALALGRFAQDLVIQQAHPSPIFTLVDELTGGSSIMPQKRNPGPLESLRTTTAGVAGDAHAVLLLIHNTPFGDIADVRGDGLWRTQQVTARAQKMFMVLEKILRGLVVDRNACLQRVEQDYSTMTELADTLLREAGVPFRIGHRVAGAVASYGRQHHKAPAQITRDQVDAIYRDITGEALPLTDQQLTRALDPRAFVQTRRGVGGPQPPEVHRMLHGHRQRLHDDQRLSESWHTHLQQATTRLDQAFAKLL